MRMASLKQQRSLFRLRRVADAVDADDADDAADADAPEPREAEHRRSKALEHPKMKSNKKLDFDSCSEEDLPRSSSPGKTFGRVLASVSAWRETLTVDVFLFQSATTARSSCSTTSTTRPSTLSCPTRRAARCRRRPLLKRKGVWPRWPRWPTPASAPSSRGGQSRRGKPIWKELRFRKKTSDK